MWSSHCTKVTRNDETDAQTKQWVYSSTHAVNNSANKSTEATVRSSSYTSRIKCFLSCSCFTSRWVSKLISLLNKLLVASSSVLLYVYLVEWVLLRKWIEVYKTSQSEGNQVQYLPDEHLVTHHRKKRTASFSLIDQLGRTQTTQRKKVHTSFSLSRKAAMILQI